jgi:BON domain
MSGYGIHMDPIRTAVKYSLIPLRTVVQLGEHFVESGSETPPPPEPSQATKRQPAKRRQPPRKRPTPQATQTPKDLDDVALARKVETIIFRDDSVPKGKIDVNAADGVVWLRGEAKNPEMIKTLEREAAAIPEVKKVENLLHMPKTPAPTRTPVVNGSS